MERSSEDLQSATGHPTSQERPFAFVPEGYVDEEFIRRARAYIMEKYRVPDCDALDDLIMKTAASLEVTQSDATMFLAAVFDHASCHPV
jgi:hypothetical protein